MRYAVDVSDLTHEKFRFFAPLLVAPVTPNRQIVPTGKNIDDMGVILECETEQAEAIIDLTKEHGIRCYRRREKGWVVC